MKCKIEKEIAIDFDTFKLSIKEFTDVARKLSWFSKFQLFLRTTDQLKRSIARNKEILLDAQTYLKGRRRM